MEQKLSKRTVVLHWVIAIAIIGMLVFGLIIEDMPMGQEKFGLLSTHKSIGAIVLVAAIARMVWRLMEGPVNPVSQLSRAQEITAKATQHTLMLGTILMPLSGLAMSIGGGRAVDVFGLELLSAGDKIEWLGSVGHIVHGVFAKIMIALILLHLLGALKHQLIDKDGTISRMLGR